MLNKVIGWFKGEESYNITSEELVERATDKSNKARMVFVDALEELGKANEELAVARDCDMRIIRELEQNIFKAQDQEVKNDEMIKKLQEIIS